MLGRGVAGVLRMAPPAKLFAEGVVRAFREADVGILNLECCISTRGAPWPDPNKPFFFRAPPIATKVLELLGVDCVSLANNHALDFGAEALLDTFDHLRRAGIRWAGAGGDIDEARRPVMLEASGMSLAVVAFTDHPAGYAAGPARPGVAYADVTHHTPDWLLEVVQNASAEADAVLVTPHWGPNFSPSPPPNIRRAAKDLRGAGATLVAGHSAHIFLGVEDHVIYDLGDFIDDYAVHPILRNDLGLLFLVTLVPEPRRLTAMPLALDYSHARLAPAAGQEAAWIRERFVRACAEFGTPVLDRGDRLIVDWSQEGTRMTAG
jgi:poly-gamma-glutamate capsule biosynthesis protein CapA/YwtB (metallophosphatase superfamily)